MQFVRACVPACLPACVCSCVFVRAGVVRQADGGEGAVHGGGPMPNNPCQNIFNDCVLDGFECDDYHGPEDGCSVQLTN